MVNGFPRLRSRTSQYRIQNVFEAAVIAIQHPVWQERPLLIVQPKPGRSPNKKDILEFLSGKVAKWWIPDDVVFVETLPHTATGKLLKTELRKQYDGYSGGPQLNKDNVYRGLIAPVSPDHPKCPWFMGG